MGGTEWLAADFVTDVADVAADVGWRFATPNLQKNGEGIELRNPVFGKNRVSDFFPKTGFLGYIKSQ